VPAASFRQVFSFTHHHALSLFRELIGLPCPSITRTTPMMRSIIFLTLCAAVSSAKSDSRNAEEAMLYEDLINAAQSPSDKRSLQEGREEGIFRATWGTDHTGSCAMAAVPTATMSCENDAEITLLDETE
jgi:hypothetical protein